MHPVACVVLALLSGALAASFFTTFLGNQIKDLTLAERGVPVQAKVVGTSSRSFGLNGSFQGDYLSVWVPPCGCAEWVPTDDPARYPTGATIPVLYDPEHPETVGPVVDVPKPWFLDVVAAGFAGCFVFVSFGACAKWWRRRHEPASDPK